MSLTSEQLATLRADIDADPVLSAIPNTQDGAYEIAQAYAQQASPDFYVYKSSITTKEVRENLVWVEYIGSSSVDEKMAFDLMLLNGVIDPSSVNVRDGIATIFGSPQQAGALSALEALYYRLANRGEKLFATGTGTIPQPATMAVEGLIAYQDVYAARQL